jgi:anti-anti-sigma regulatory factor
MQVKIDTKEKFHAITILESALAANMTAELDKCLLPLLQNGVKNVVLNLKDIQTLDYAAAQHLEALQAAFHQKGASFVVCAIQPAAAAWLEAHGSLASLNVAPSQSEAQDIILLEEIERELLD